MEGLRTPFSKTELQIMQLLRKIETQEELNALKSFISEYYANKLTEETNRIWDERGYTQQTMESWLNEPT